MKDETGTNHIENVATSDHNIDFIKKNKPCLIVDKLRFSTTEFKGNVLQVDREKTSPKFKRIESEWLIKRKISCVIQYGIYLCVEYYPSYFISKGAFNLHPVNQIDLERQIKAIALHLKSIGIITSFKKSKVKELHITLDRVMNHPIGKYHREFKLANFSKGIRKNIGKTYYINTKSDSLMFYDKGEKLIKDIKKEGRKIPDCYKNKHLLRCEWKLLKKHKIQSMLGTSDLFSVINSYEILSKKFQAYLKSSFTWERKG